MQNVVATLEDDNGGCVRLQLHGRIDSRRSPEFYQVATEAVATPNANVILDLADTPFIGIAGFQIILSLRAALHASGRHLKFENVTEDIAAIAKLCGLNEALDDL